MLVPPYWYQALVPSPTSASEDPGLSVIAVKPVDAVAALAIAIVPPGLSVKVPVGDPASVMVPVGVIGAIVPAGAV